MATQGHGLSGRSSNRRGWGEDTLATAHADVILKMTGHGPHGRTFREERKAQVKDVLRIAVPIGITDFNTGVVGKMC